MLDVFLTLKRVANVFKNFEMNQLFNVVTLRVAGDSLLPVFINAADQIIRDANVQRTARTACKNVNVIWHTPSMDNRDGRDKPGHDNNQDWLPP